MKICVLSRTSADGSNDPYVFHLGQRRLPVVGDRRASGLEPPYRYFKVRVEDGRRFVLRHDADHRRNGNSRRPTAAGRCGPPPPSASSASSSPYRNPKIPTSNR